MFSKILIANRGEIAVRVIRTAHEMGISCVAVYSEPDRDALHVRMADEAYLIGPAASSQSYLDARKLIDVARRAGAEAIHPGYGFLAENAGFARAVVEAGLVWIGPNPDAIFAMGDKLRSRIAMQRAKIPVVPGGTDPIETVEQAREFADRYGFPLALKASGGGGGKGLKIARSAEEIESALATARREAEAYFNNGTIYAERYLENPKHVELQVLADRHGNAIHVGERDCSLQRRHQKLWEEAPAQISATLRGKMRAAAVQAAKAIGYDSVGTIECLVAGDRFYFLEMNTRIQVEHTVTEMISGLDLIREQIRVAAGEPLGIVQDDVRFDGFAIEGRVNAEDPSQDFRPAPGTVTKYREPGGLGVRVDSAAYPGITITPEYDSMIAKLIVWAPTRTHAIARFRRAIDEFVIEGVPTTLPLLRALCDHPLVIDGSYGTQTLETFAQTLRIPNNGGAGITTGDAVPVADTIAVEVNDKLYRVRVIGAASRRRGDEGLRPPRRLGTTAKRAAIASGNDVVSPMHGVVVELKVREGDAVAEGQVVAVIEAMKMMNEIRAHKSGAAAKLHAAVGATVEAGSPLVSLA
ncbi:MAG: acetyl-CoA carboxylase biotin carboxylase subunit [Candidatus Eremiobacteraeota bacterium]|nr:acetyl-CoA carboxylase biotin carboxylase subunit [Candidatus Eremiobacteraeota bacterium]